MASRRSGTLTGRPGGRRHRYGVSVWLYRLRLRKKKLGNAACVLKTRVVPIGNGTCEQKAAANASLPRHRFAYDSREKTIHRGNSRHDKPLENYPRPGYNTQSFPRKQDARRYGGARFVFSGGLVPGVTSWHTLDHCRLQKWGTRISRARVDRCAFLSRRSIDGEIADVTGEEKRWRPFD